jgi:phosphoribosyl 1,2-cyclic phosphodiesterase
VKLTFLGTRANIEARTRRHRMHSAMMVTYYGRHVMVDCGEDWLGALDDLSPAPEAIVITHAHPDHAWGLQEGAPCPVYATEASWENMETFPIEDRHVLTQREPIEIRGIAFEAFPVLHSTRAPAAGYRITAGRTAIFYVPDVAWIEDRAGALQGVRIYVGDGATITRSMVRKPGDVIIGHVPLRTQLTWCEKEGVDRAIFTHLGSKIVEGDERTLNAQIRDMAEERGIEEVTLAHDGMEIVLR